MPSRPRVTIAASDASDPRNVQIAALGASLRSPDYRRALIDSALMAVAIQFELQRHAVEQQLFASPLFQGIQEQARQWQELLSRLEAHGIRRDELEALLPDPLDALTSAKRLNEALELAQCLKRADQLWPAGDDKGRAQLLRSLDRARAELKRTRADAKAARFEPGQRGRRMPIPDPGLSWAEVIERYPEWRNPVEWPWLGDRAANVAHYLAQHVRGKRKAGGAKAGKVRGRLYTNAVLELTAEVLNRRYSLFLFHDLHFTPGDIKRRIAKRKPKKSRKSR